MSETPTQQPAVVRGEPEAEAGVGAVAANDETPDNVVLPRHGNGPDSRDSNVPSDRTAIADNGDKNPQAGAPEQQRSRAKIAIIMFALGMAVFLAAMDITIITTALPTISEHFHSAAGYTWIGSAFNLAAAASTPLWGKISDIFGRKPVLLIANIVFFIGSLIAALSINIGMLITARAIQGIGGGGLIILVNIVISDLFSMRSRGAYYGIIGMVWALASALGPVIGGAFTQKVSWRWCFYINLPLDGLAFVIILFLLDVHTPRTPIMAGLKAIDWLGSLAVVGGTLMLLLGLEFGGVSYAWDSATVICLIVFGVVTAGIFLLIEWKVANYPIMPLKLFSNRSNMAALAVCFIHGFVFISATYYLPLYFQAVLGATPILSGVYLLAFALSLSVTSAITGIIIRKTGAYRPCIWVGMAILVVGWGLFCDIDADSSWTKIFLYQIVAGIGVGPNFQSPLIALQSMVHPRDIATATATFGFVRNLATAISVVIGGVVFQNEMAKKSGTLRASLGDQVAGELSGGSAGANVEIVDALPAAQRQVARTAFADSLATTWIVYACFAAFGLLISFLIAKNTLSKQHVEMKTGLEAEEERRRVRKEEKDEQARKRQSGMSGMSTDVERADGMETPKEKSDRARKGVSAVSALSGRTMNAEPIDESDVTEKQT